MSRVLLFEFAAEKTEIKRLLTNLNGLNRAALRGFLSRGLLFREDLVPGSGYAFLRHQKDVAAHADTQAAADAVVVDMDGQNAYLLSLFEVVFPQLPGSYCPSGENRQNKRKI